MIKTMGGNIPGENFLSGNFPGGIFQGRGGGGGGGVWAVCRGRLMKKRR